MTALYTSRMAYPKRRLWIESCVGISGKIGEDAIMDGPRTFHLLTKKVGKEDTHAKLATKFTKICIKKKTHQPKHALTS